MSEAMIRIALRDNGPVSPELSEWFLCVAQILQEEVERDIFDLMAFGSTQPKGGS